MLVKLKRRFRHAKNVMCRTFRVEKREKLILQDFHVDWDGLSSFIEDMNKSPHASGPLKAAVDELRGCIGVFESNHRLATIRSREEYEKLGVDINDLFRALPIFIDGTSISPVHEHVAQLARDITNAVPDTQGEQLEVEQESERGMGVGKILVCYRQVRILLGRFVLTENTRIWEIQDENILATRLDILPHSPTTQYQPVVESNDVRPTGCMPNTRMNLLRQLRNWTHHDGGQRIFWLNGLAGTGKTTVASSFCEQLENSGNLAAGFFCSRYLSECRDFEHILPSISYQLSSISRPFRCALSDALKNLELHNLPLSEQLAKLVTEPLLKVKHTFLPNMIIVIDALDECPDDEGVKQILDILIKRASDSPVKFFITSRPTPTILNRMRSKEDERVLFELRLHDINRWGVDGDIQTYLVAELKPANLSEPQIESLVLQSGLSFNYAAAIVRYLGHNNFSQTIKRLNLLLGAPNSLAKESIRDIDTLYTTVMRTAFDNNVPESLERDETRLVLCTLICAQGPLTVEGLAGLLSFESASSVEKALLPLWPLLQVSDTSRLVTIQYEWVVNYMLDHQRSNRLHCDAKEHHTRLARICFDLIHMPNPPFNICKLESSYTRDWEVPNIEKRVQEAISPELLYACRHWGSHVELAGYPEDLLNRIHGFLATRLLLWMEILNLNRCIDAATSQLSRLHARLGEIDGAAIIQDLVHDAWRFALALSSSPMRDSTPHIYVSALPFWPKQRPVSKQYTRGMLSCVSVTGAGMRKREYASFAVLYSADTVTCIAYSPNGAYIVSASRDRTIRIWDTHTGQSVGQPLKGHTDTVNSVAYSPNGAYIVSGSRDKTIRMWDAQTGQPVGQPLEGHTHWVNSVAYPPNGEFIISGSHDRTIRIWDARTGQPVGQPIKGHESSVRSVACSPNGAYIVSGSEDRTIRIWDAHTGQLVGQPLKGHMSLVRSVAYSPSGAYIVSGSEDKTIRIWDVHTGQLVGQPLKGHTSLVKSVAYSPNGACIVSGSHDKTIWIWDAQTGKPVGQPLEGHKYSVWSVSYSPNGAYIVSGSDDNTIRIWDAHTGQPVGQPLEGHESSVHSVAYSPNGAYIVSGSGDETIRIWETRQAEMQEPVAEVSSTLSAPPPESENPLSHRAQHAPHISETATSRITECKSDEVGVLLDDWSLNEQGWVVNAKQDQLIWVPHELRDTRLRLRNNAVISHPGSIKLDFSDAKLGREWGRCFDPKRLLDVN